MVPCFQFSHDRQGRHRDIEIRLSVTRQRLCLDVLPFATYFPSLSPTCRYDPLSELIKASQSGRLWQTDMVVGNKRE
jgi:hypothetical protein